jgi:hypothetical protein
VTDGQSLDVEHGPPCEGSTQVKWSASHTFDGSAHATGPDAPWASQSWTQQKFGLLTVEQPPDALADEITTRSVRSVARID